MKNKINLGFIGCGEWARKKYLPLLSTNKNVVSISVSNLKYQSEQKKILEILPTANIFSDYSEMIEQTSLDGIIVSLPHALHSQACHHAIHNNIPTLVDKPLSPTYLEANELVKLSLQRNTALWVASQRREYPGFSFLRNDIRDGKLGKVLWIKSEFLFYSYPNWEKTWRNNPILSGKESLEQGILLDAGYHVIDSALYILNMTPTRVYAEVSKSNHKVDTEVVATMGFSNEVKASIVISRSLPYGYENESTSILGTKGYAISQESEFNGQKNSSYTSFRDGSKKTKEMPIVPYKFKPMEDFIEMLKKGGEKTIASKWSASMALDTLKVIDALYESVKTRSVVYL